jgi:hypothetical protein
MKRNIIHPLAACVLAMIPASTAFPDEQSEIHHCNVSGLARLFHSKEIPLCTMTYIDTPNIGAAICSDRIEFLPSEEGEGIIVSLSNSFTPGGGRIYRAISDADIEFPLSALGLFEAMTECISEQSCEQRGDEDGLRLLDTFSIARSDEVTIGFASPLVSISDPDRNPLIEESFSLLPPNAWLVMTVSNGARHLLVVNSLSPLDAGLRYSETRAAFLQSSEWELVCPESGLKE